MAIPRIYGSRLGVAGNAVELLVDGEAVFGAMLAACSDATRFICLETYIFAHDTVGKAFLAALVAAARRGVEVYVLVDGVGSMGTGRAFFAPLLVVGGRLAIFHPVRLGGPLRLFWRRDHRKIIVVDGHTAFIGGLNIVDAQASVHGGGGGWHDMHARVRGPAARELLGLFARTWRRAAKEPFLLPRPQVMPQGPTTVYILESSFGRRRNIRRAYLAAVRQAQHSVRICSAYFIPDRTLVRALIQAKKRGVVVQLLLAGVTDVVPVQFASRALYHRLLVHGVQIFEWPTKVLHAKTIVTDGLWCSVGSYNMDRRSLLYNLEANIACYDASFAEALEQQFAADISEARPILLSQWHRRPALFKILERLFYFLRYWL